MDPQAAIAIAEAKFNAAHADNVFYRYLHDALAQSQNSGMLSFIDAQITAASDAEQTYHDILGGLLGL